MIALYIEAKEKSSGKRNNTRRWLMCDFDRYCAERGHGSCTKEAIEGWGTERDIRTTSGVRSWISVVREFGRFLRMNGDFAAYILSGKHRQRKVRPKPYVLSQYEVDAFFSVAPAPKMRKSPWQWQSLAFFGLMCSCGLRTCEARNLKTADVDITGKTIDIMDSKGKISRRLYIDDGVAGVLEECDWHSSKFAGVGRSPFFVSLCKSPVDATTTGKMFKRIWEQAELPLVEAENKPKPRPYDLRHRFAYANIERWAAEGKDVNTMLPYLQRCMGHSDINQTLYYVHTSPDFIAGYAELVRTTEKLLPEVGFDD
jgi:integrase